MQYTEQLNQVLTQAIQKYAEDNVIKTSLLNTIKPSIGFLTFLVVTIIIFLFLVKFDPEENKLEDYFFSFILSFLCTAILSVLTALITLFIPVSYEPTSDIVTRIIKDYKVEEISGQFDIPKFTKDVFQNSDGTLRTDYLPTQTIFPNPSPSIPLTLNEKSNTNLNNELPTDENTYTFAYKYLHISGDIYIPMRLEGVRDEITELINDTINTFTEEHLVPNSYIIADYSTDSDAYTPILDRTLIPTVNIQPTEISSDNQGIKLQDKSIFHIPEQVEFVQSDTCEIHQVSSLTFGNAPSEQDIILSKDISPDIKYCYYYVTTSTTIFYQPTSSTTTDVNVGVDVNVQSN